MFSFLQTLHFVHSWMLILLPLAALPLLLHLLTLQRLKTVELSTFRFLFDSYIQQRRRTQFLEALIAFLRTLFLLVIVLVMMRPILREQDGLVGGSEGTREVILMMDCSESMNRVYLGESAFERAKKEAKNIVAKLRPDDRLTLIRVTGRSEEVFTRYTPDARGLVEAIDGLRTSPARANLYSALVGLFGPEGRKPNNPLVYFVTDAQKSGWQELLDSRGRDEVAAFLPEKLPFTVVQVGGGEETANVAIVGDAPSEQELLVGLPVLMQARIINHGQAPTTVRVRLFLEEPSEQGSETREDIEARIDGLTLNPRDQRLLPLPPRYFEKAGTVRGRFVLDAPNDPFPADNEFAFTLRIRPKIRVLIVNGGTTRDGVTDEAYHIRRNLRMEAVEEGGVRLPGVARIAKMLAVDVVRESELTPERLRNIGVVILANCGNLTTGPTGQYQLLRQFVNDGGGLIVCPGDKVNPDALNLNFFSLYEGRAGGGFVNAKFLPAVGDPEKPDTFVAFQTPRAEDYRHPILQVFEPSRNNGINFFEGILTKRRFPILPFEKDAPRALLRFADNARSPALLSARFGEGEYLITAFPLSDEWSRLPAFRQVLVPLLLRMIQHVARPEEATGPAVVEPGSTARFFTAGSWAPVRGEVVPPDGKQSYPLTFERSGRRQVAEFGQTSERGFYSVRMRSGGVSRPELSTAFAVNLAPEEATLERIGTEAMQSALPKANLAFVETTFGSDREYWRPLIWLTLAIITIEFLLATMRGGRGPDEDQPSLTERVRQYNPVSLVHRMTGGNQPVK